MKMGWGNVCFEGLSFIPPEAHGTLRMRQRDGLCAITQIKGKRGKSASFLTDRSMRFLRQSLLTATAITFSDLSCYPSSLHFRCRNDHHHSLTDVIRRLGSHQVLRYRFASDLTSQSVRVPGRGAGWCEEALKHTFLSPVKELQPQHTPPPPIKEPPGVGMFCSLTHTTPNPALKKIASCPNKEQEAQKNIMNDQLPNACITSYLVTI